MGGVKKLLPKLLIAAVLINFSLVIAGGLIDLSRVFMAIETRALTDGASLSTIAAKVLEKSNLVNSVYKVTQGDAFMLSESQKQMDDRSAESAGTKWSNVGEQILANVMITGLAIAMFTIAAAFYVRHIILLLLLILSPIPYLAFVLPQTSGLAKKWWDTFLRWVLYGPAALFFLILIISLGNEPTDYVPGDNGVYNTIIRTALVTILLFLAATSAKFIGAAGAGAAVAFAAGATKRGARFGLATTGLPAAAWLGKKAGQRAKNEGRAFASKATEPLQRRFGVGKQSPFDEKGNLKAGKSTRMSRAGEAIGTGVGLLPGIREQSTVNKRNQAQAAYAAMTGPGGPNYNDAALLGNRLKQRHVTEGLGATQAERNTNVNMILENGSASQMKGLAQNKDYIRSVEPAQLGEIERVIMANAAPGVTAGDKQKAIEELYKTLDEIAKE